MKYYTIQNGQLLTAENKGALANYYDNVQELPLDYEVGKYIVKDNELVLNPHFEEIKAQEEKERIGLLYLTGADVERAILKAKGMDFDDVIAYLPTLGIDEMTIKAIKVELKANHFYRGNPYVEQIGALLGFTSEQLTKFFETNDYTVLLPLEVVDEEKTELD